MERIINAKAIKHKRVVRVSPMRAIKRVESSKPHNVKEVVILKKHTTPPWQYKRASLACKKNDVRALEARPFRACF